MAEAIEPIRLTVRRQQLMRLVQQLPANLVANLIVVVTFVLVFLDKVDQNLLIVWVIYSQVVNLLGFLLILRSRGVDDAAQIDRRLSLFSFYGIADGLTSAAAFWLFFMPGGGFYNIFLFMVLMGVSAGGQSTLLSHLGTALPFSLVITFAATTRLLLTGENDYYILAIMALVFSGVLMRIAISFNRNLLNTWQLQCKLEAELMERKHMEEVLHDSEERYRSLVETSPDAIVVQRGNEIVYVNQVALSLFGAHNIEQLVGRDLRELCLIEQTREDRETIHSLLEYSRGFQPVEVELKRLDGKRLEAEVAGSLINYDGRSAMQLVMRDISERRAMDKMKDEFISTVSHELRTPITSILGAIGIIRGAQSDDLNEKQRMLVEIIYNNSQTLTSLVNDILDVSKLEGGKLQLSYEESSIDELLDQVVSDNTPYAIQFKVDLLLNKGHHADTIVTDPTRFRQILSNIISNAIKHSPPNEGVEIRTSSDDTYLQISVQDQGSGIPKEFEQRIFHKFEQSQANPTRTIKGSGLGLYLTKSLVEQFRGKIWYESKGERGTTFFVQLPFRVH